MKTKEQLLKEKAKIETELKKLENTNKEDERLTFWNKWSDKEHCLEAVKRNGYSLRFVKNQTDEICLEAVKRNGYSLQYVKNQTDEICLEAVKQDGDLLLYVKLPSAFEKITGLKVKEIEK